MSAEREVWGDAYARQGRSDWSAYIQLGRLHIERCHRLHFLQMACEKIAKAYRFRYTATAAEGLLSRHTGFARFMNAFLLSPTIAGEFRGKTAALQSLRARVRVIAQEVERLAPAVARENSPSNAEYPWEHEGRVVVPCDFEFPNLSFLEEASGRTFLNLVSRAVRDYEVHAI
jgi:hypothetical protein